MRFRMIWLGPEDELGGQTSPQERPPEPDASFVRYERTGAGIVRREQQRNGRIKITAVANFVAIIERDIVCDDDDEAARAFGIQAEVGGRTCAFVLPAAEFSRMNWVLRDLGPEAIIYPGQQQHARAAIQYLSTDVRREHLFTHLGWSKSDSGWIYLHSGGAIGPAGTLGDGQVHPSLRLQNYRLYRPDDADARLKAVRSSLRFLAVAPDRIILPLLAAVYRAPLGGTDFSVFLTGRTGTFKTALAALCQQHFGPDMDANHLPANFASTANSIEELAFAAKDTLLVVDDFAPTGGMGDSPLYALAERLFRAAGNHQGRSRMDGLNQMRAPRPPRALLLATGEEMPRGHSLRARSLIVQVRPGEVDLTALSECQSAGHSGLFAMAMGAYLEWISARYNRLQEGLRERVLELRRHTHAHSVSIHPRLPTTLSELQAGLEIWLQFALDVGAVTRAKEKELRERACLALRAVERSQAQYHRASDPAERFINLLQAAMAGGHAHVADRCGRAPDCPECWGWRKRNRSWLAQGMRIGWAVSNDVFLEPAVSYEVAQRLAGSERLPLSAQTLRHRLHEHGLLASMDAGRQMLLVRRTVEGRQRQVLHLKACDLVNSLP